MVRENRWDERKKGQKLGIIVTIHRKNCKSDVATADYASLERKCTKQQEEEKSKNTLRFINLLAVYHSEPLHLKFQLFISTF